MSLSESELACDVVRHSAGLGRPSMAVDGVCACSRTVDLGFTKELRASSLLALAGGVGEIPRSVFVVGCCRAPETKELSDDGAKLQPDNSPESSSGAKDAAGRPMGVHRMQMELSGHQVMGLAAQGVSIQDFAQQLSRQVGTAVVDKTGLKGNYDFNLHWTADTAQQSGGNPSAGSATSLSTAIQQQLGLRLEPQTEAMQVLVIEHIDKPTAN